MKLKFWHGRCVKVKARAEPERYEPLHGGAYIQDNDTIVPGSKVLAWFYDIETIEGEKHREGPFDSIEAAVEDSKQFFLLMREPPEPRGGVGFIPASDPKFPRARRNR